MAPQDVGSDYEFYKEYPAIFGLNAKQCEPFTTNCFNFAVVTFKVICHNLDAAKAAL